jgi:hypothetical protein
VVVVWGRYCSCRNGLGTAIFNSLLIDDDEQLWEMTFPKWREADADVPILNRAKAEYAEPQSLAA